jgi:hypothetical protein
MAFLFIVINYLEGPSFLLLLSATVPGRAGFSLQCRHLPGMAVFSLIGVGYLDGLAFLFFYDSYLEGFSLHCHQLPGEVVFSLIDVSYLEGLSFLFMDASYLTGLSFIFIVVTYLKSSSFLLLTSATWTWKVGFSFQCRQSSTSWRGRLFSSCRQLPERAGFYLYEGSYLAGLSFFFQFLQQQLCRPPLGIFLPSPRTRLLFPIHSTSCTNRTKHVGMLCATPFMYNIMEFRIQICSLLAFSPRIKCLSFSFIKERKKCRKPMVIPQSPFSTLLL